MRYLERRGYTLIERDYRTRCGELDLDLRQDDGEDVLPRGIIGLLDAVDTYDPERGTKLESYAISKIRWSILDRLRRTDPMTRRGRRWAREVELAKGRRAQRLERTPSEEAVAQELWAPVSPSTRRFWTAVSGLRWPR